MTTENVIVKVCGIKRPEDAQLCAELGANMLGFIFHPKSPRCVQPGLPASVGIPGVRKVGVFVEQSVEDIVRLMEIGGLHLAQLHGGQDAAFCKALAAAIGPERIIKVVWPERAATPEAFQGTLNAFTPFCAGFLADAGTSGGGHGRVIAAGEEPGALDLAVFPKPLILSGGLGPENLRSMLDRYLPVGVDLNSGVESAPGVKDEKLLRAAFAEIRARAAQHQEVLP